MGERNSSLKGRARIAARTGDLSGSLSYQLAAYREQSSRLRPEFAKAYDQLVSRLDKFDRGEIGPKIGEKFPQFHLPDENGKLISLSSLLERGPVVVSINRGHWCPYCKLELRSLAAIFPEIEKLGAQIVSIMPDSAQFTKRSIEVNTLPFPILSDIDLGYSLLLGLVYWVGAEIKQLYENVGIELEKYQGNNSYFLPTAAKFVIDQNGLVRARQVNVEFRQRMEPEEIVVVLKTLRSGG